MAMADGGDGSEGEYEARKSMQHPTQCMPRLWRKSTTAAAATQASLLDRFRETVLKIIMISAVGRGGGGGRARGGERAAGGGCSGRQQHIRHLHPDSYRSEAVEECIEFFKRSSAVAAAEGGGSSSGVCEEAKDLEVNLASLQVM